MFTLCGLKQCWFCLVFFSLSVSIFICSDSLSLSHTHTQVMGGLHCAPSLIILHQVLSVSCLLLHCSSWLGYSSNQTQRRAHEAELFPPRHPQRKTSCTFPFFCLYLKECCDLIQRQFCQWCVELILHTSLLFMGEFMRSEAKCLGG